MNLQLALIPGDGIGPEVLGAAVRVLDKIAKKFGHTVSYAEVDAGGVSIDKYGDVYKRQGQVQSSGRSSNFVPAAIPFSGSPSSSS